MEPSTTVQICKTKRIFKSLLYSFPKSFTGLNRYPKKSCTPNFFNNCSKEIWLKDKTHGQNSSFSAIQKRTLVFFKINSPFARQIQGKGLQSIFIYSVFPPSTFYLLFSRILVYISCNPDSFPRKYFQVLLCCPDFYFESKTDFFFIHLFFFLFYLEKKMLQDLFGI